MTHSLSRVARATALAALGVWTSACGDGGASRAASDEAGVTLTAERYELDNGMEVILHVDRSDPIAAVAMTFHVGSAREVAGRTGFAHLFEHLFFLDSENLGPGGLDRLMTRIGSSTNGSTSNDRTNYFEVVPVDGLEKTLWAEADKLGWFINTVTEDVVAKEKQVVKNEKRQGVDNVPYGHSSDVLDRALYPEGHPYRWQVIGSLADLDAATLADVKAFHERWYGPNNLTLVVAGDIDVEKTKEWIARYFGEVPRRALPEIAPVPEVVLTESVALYHEDNFARLPQLQMSWPTVPRFHADEYALDVLGRILSDGKNAPLYKVVVEQDKLAPRVSAYNSSAELAGTFNITVRGFSGVNLNTVKSAVDSGLARFEREGVPASELARVLAGTETAFYAGLSSNIGKAFQLADYAIFAHDPNYLQEDLKRTLGVTADDVMRVYRQYIAGQPWVAASFVPKGSASLALANSRKADVVDEPIVLAAEAPVEINDRETIVRTPSAIDRAVEPPAGSAPTLRAPTVWERTLDNGVRVLGIEDDETPLVQFELRIRGGQLAEDRSKVGVANLLAQSMTQGTARRTPAELEQAIDLLGASINVSAGREAFSIRGSTLARNWDSTMALVEEILLEPRYDSVEVELARQGVESALRQQASSPNALASGVFARLLYGDHILAENTLGTLETLPTFTIADLKAYHAKALVPALAAMHVAGAVDEGAVTRAMASLASKWTGTAPALAQAPTWAPARAGLYMVDVPNASQSVLNIGYLALPETDAQFWPATVMNFRLGGGGFASELTQVLREGKGYTYGIRSGFSGSDIAGPFSISSSVRSNVTLEALQDIQRIVQDFGPTYDPEDLEATQGYLLRANAGAFETLGAKLGVLADMSSLGFPSDYVLRRESVVRDFTVEEAKSLATSYLDPARMIWLVVGDARTQQSRLAALGLGPVRVLDRNGRAMP